MRSEVVDVQEQGLRPRGLFRSLPTAPKLLPYGRADVISMSIIGILALLTRLVGVTTTTSHGTPVFDEKHYVPQAWDMLNSAPNPLIGGIESNPGYGLVVHPPLGKQLLSLGEWVFGYTPLGWRIMPVIFGVLTVLAIMALTRELSQSWQIASFAGILALFDGVLLVGSRHGMLDIFQVFFIVTAVWALVRDHHQAHRLWHTAYVKGELDTSGTGPRVGVRWWRFFAGMMLGLALSVKWSGLYYMAFFGLFIVIADAVLRRRYGVRRPALGTLIKDAPAAFASLVILPVGLYLLSFRAWFSSETSVYRHAAVDGSIASDSWLQHLPDALASFIYYHATVLEFHASLTSSSGHSHPWDSKPWSWLAATRPVLYYSAHDVNCSVGTCRRMIYLFGTPAIWWLTIPVLLYACWRVLRHLDATYAWPLVAFAAGFIPWVINSDRQMYYFYALPLVPFTICLLALVLGRITGRGRPLRWPPLVHLAGFAPPVGTVITIVYLGIVVAMFLAFSPILYGFLVPDSYIDALMWLPSWK